MNKHTKQYGYGRPRNSRWATPGNERSKQGARAAVAVQVSEYDARTALPFQIHSWQKILEKFSVPDKFSVLMAEKSHRIPRNISDRSELLFTTLRL